MPTYSCLRFNRLTELHLRWAEHKIRRPEQVCLQRVHVIRLQLRVIELIERLAVSSVDRFAPPVDNDCPVPLVFDEKSTDEVRGSWFFTCVVNAHFARSTVRSSRLAPPRIRESEDGACRGASCIWSDHLGIHAAFHCFNVLCVCSRVRPSHVPSCTR